MPLIQNIKSSFLVSNRIIEQRLARLKMKNFADFGDLRLALLHAKKRLPNAAQTQVLVLSLWIVRVIGREETRNEDPYWRAAFRVHAVPLLVHHKRRTSHSLPNPHRREAIPLPVLFL